jgi:hypothetical protein
MNKSYACISYRGLCSIVYNIIIACFDSDLSCLFNERQKSHVFCYYFIIKNRYYHKLYHANLFCNESQIYNLRKTSLWCIHACVSVYCHGACSDTRSLHGTYAKGTQHYATSAMCCIHTRLSECCSRGPEEYS